MQAKAKSWQGQTLLAVISCLENAEELLGLPNAGELLSAHQISAAGSLREAQLLAAQGRAGRKLQGCPWQGSAHTTDTCRVRSELPLPPQLQLLPFAASSAACRCLASHGTGAW